MTGWALAQDGALASTRPLIAGQNTVIGQVACGMEPQDDHLGRCRAQTVAGWCLTRAHLYVGATAPVTLAPGQFPFRTESGACVSDLTVGFRSETACVGQPLTMAFHAEARQPSVGREETAWGQGARTGNNWSMAFELPCRVITD